jgi:hypoxanthine phosphoribosyltransferase
MGEPPVSGAQRVATAAAVRDAWSRLAAAIQPHVEARPCLLLGVLLGGMVPLVKISELLRGDFLLDYCHVTRYGGGTSGGDVRWISRPRADLRGLTVVLVDDIFDEGHTLSALRAECLDSGAERVLVAVLARKRHGRALPDITPDFVGLDVADEYVFGCGMDYQGRWRHLDEIYALPSRAAAVAQS